MSATTHFPVLTPQEAAELIDHGAKVGIGGFTGAGTIKATGRALAARATAEHEAGRPFQIRILSGSSTGHSVDGALAAANAISAPQLKVSPSHACGHHVIRFMNG